MRQNLQNESNSSEGSERKRPKVVSQKEKLTADIFRGREERLQILKRMAEKTEEAEPHNPVFTFFKSMAQTVTHFPPSIIAETRMKICQLVAQMEAKALHEQNQARASGFPFHNFTSSSFDLQCPVIPVTVMFRQHPASHLFKCCRLQAQQLIHVATFLLQKQHQCQHLLRMERNGEAVQMTNLTSTPPALLMSLSDSYIYVFGILL